MAQIKRETAVICSISTLLNGEYVKTEGWTPSYFSTESGDVSRVNLTGVVVSIEGNGAVIDDGSGRIILRSFDHDFFSTLQVGDFVLVVGRPRVYNQEKYILPEIVNKIDQKWGEYRQLRLRLTQKNKKPAKEKPRRVEIKDQSSPVNYFQKILDFVKDLDDGDGADLEEVKKRSQAPNADELIRKLIEEGEIFELRPGRLKLLE